MFHLSAMLVFLLIMAGTVGCEGKQAHGKRFLGVPIDAVTNERDALLNTWYPRIIDKENGGYWTNFEHDWTRAENQEKFLVTQARGLWMASRAAGIYLDNLTYREAADHGYQYLTQVMWDEHHSGFHQHMPVRESTTPHKTAYGNAFALFGLAEYAKVNKDPQVLLWVRKAFNWLEENAHDPVHLGYNNVIFDERLDGLDPAVQETVKSVSRVPTSWKDQNSSIHILEALTTTYEVLPDKMVGLRLQEMINLLRDTMVHPDGYLQLYFTRAWEPIDHSNGSRAYIIDNLDYDHRSFGHDIEAAFLLMNADKVLNGYASKKTVEVAKRLVEQTITHGFDDAFYGLYDRGYMFEGTKEVEVLSTRKTWWAQAEAWHSFALMAILFPENPVYQKGYQQMWRYIQSEVIDHEHGGWYAHGLDENPESENARKAHAWKSAYHNGRALCRVIEYSGRNDS